jgi:type II secretory pathway predicted ATPase ExeA
MVEAYWELTRNPFHCGWDFRYYYPARSHEVCLARLRYLVDWRGEAGVLVGASGVGKSTLIQLLFSKLGKSVRPRVYLSVGGLSAAQTLILLPRRLEEVDLPWPTDVVEALDILQEFLHRNAEEGHHCLIVLDDADLSGEERVWDYLRCLSSLRTSTGAMVTFIFVGQYGLLPKLVADSSWRERIAAMCVLRPLGRRETHQYVVARLTAAESKRPIFTSAALDRIYELSGGIPARINRLCNLALVYGFAEGAELILPEHIEAVADELAFSDGEHREPPALAA